MNDLDIGRICVAQGRFEEAKNRFRHAQQLNNDGNLLVQMLRAQKRYVDADTENKEAINALKRREDAKNLLHTTCFFKQGLVASDKKDVLLARYVSHVTILDMSYSHQADI